MSVSDTIPAFLANFSLMGCLHMVQPTKPKQPAHNISKTTSPWMNLHLRRELMLGHKYLM